MDTASLPMDSEVVELWCFSTNSCSHCDLSMVGRCYGGDAAQHRDQIVTQERVPFMTDHYGPDMIFQYNTARPNTTIFTMNNPKNARINDLRVARPDCHRAHVGCTGKTSSHALSGKPPYLWQHIYICNIHWPNGISNVPLKPRLKLARTIAQCRLYVDTATISQPPDQHRRVVQLVHGEPHVPGIWTQSIKIAGNWASPGWSPLAKPNDRVVWRKIFVRAVSTPSWHEN